MPAADSADTAASRPGFVSRLRGLLADALEGLSGIAISCAIEGVRPFLVETQALVSTTTYGTPQRSTTGFNQRRPL